MKRLPRLPSLQRRLPRYKKLHPQVVLPRKEYYCLWSLLPNRIQPIYCSIERRAK